MSIAISKIFKEAKREGMPVSAPGIILYSLEASIIDKHNKNKAHKYKVPYFTDAKLLTHDQLERINNIIAEKHNLKVDSINKDSSIVDISKYHLDENEYPYLSKESSKESFKESSKEDIINKLEKEWNEDLECSKIVSNKKSHEKNQPKRMSKYDKLNKYKQHH